MTQPPNEPQEKTAEELQAQFNGMFETAMDAWLTKRKEAEEQEAPKRTQKPRGIFTELFGG